MRTGIAIIVGEYFWDELSWGEGLEVEVSIEPEEGRVVGIEILVGEGVEGDEEVGVFVGVVALVEGMVRWRRCGRIILMG